LRGLAKANDMIFIDCIRALAGLAKPLVLQHDGFHLSQEGHRVVGQAIAQSIVADIVTRFPVTSLREA
jgi:lysophospholipase L1-like esterase